MAGRAKDCPDIQPTVGNGKPPVFADCATSKTNESNAGAEAMTSAPGDAHGERPTSNTGGQQQQQQQHWKDRPSSNCDDELKRQERIEAQKRYNAQRQREFRQRHKERNRQFIQDTFKEDNGDLNKQNKYRGRPWLNHYRNNEYQGNNRNGHHSPSWDRQSPSFYRLNYSNNNNYKDRHNGNNNNNYRNSPRNFGVDNYHWQANQFNSQFSYRGNKFHQSVSVNQFDDDPESTRRYLGEEDASRLIPSNQNKEQSKDLPLTNPQGNSNESKNDSNTKTNEELTRSSPNHFRANPNGKTTPTFNRNRGGLLPTPTLESPTPENKQTGAVTDNGNKKTPRKKNARNRSKDSKESPKSNTSSSANPQVRIAKPRQSTSSPKVTQKSDSTIQGVTQNSTISQQKDSPNTKKGSEKSPIISNKKLQVRIARTRRATVTINGNSPLNRKNKQLPDPESAKNLVNKAKASNENVKTSPRISIPCRRSTISGIQPPSNIQFDSTGTTQAIPKIQVRPLAQLLKQEILAVTQEERLGTLPTEGSSRQSFRPVVHLRQRTVSSSSNSGAELTINERLATMDKEGLKYIINNSDTIYDEHLKLQARKKLREEIRRQLKVIEQEQPKDKPANELIEDEIVDAIKLPEVLLQEIHKFFGIDISASTNSIDTKEAIKLTADTEMQEKEVCAEKSTETENSNQLITSNISKPTEENEQIQVPASTSTEEESHSCPTATSPCISVKQEPIAMVTNSTTESVVVLSSSEDETEMIVDVSPRLSQRTLSSESNDSQASNSSERRRKLQKMKSANENVVKSFESLILPQISDLLRERYRDKHSGSIQDQLHFISCICTSEYNSKKFSKIEVARIQHNLKSEDNQIGIEFLLREIVNVVNLQKQVSRRKQQDEQQNDNDINVEPPPPPPPTTPIVNANKSAEVSTDLQSAAETHQKKCSENAEASVQTVEETQPQPNNKTPPPVVSTVEANASSEGQVQLPLLSHPSLGLETTLQQISGNLTLPVAFNATDPRWQMALNDSVAQNLLEIDRKLLENQNRRSFLDEMILKFQKERSDLEMVGLELQTRKFLLLNTALARSQASPTPTPSAPAQVPPPPAPASNPIVTEVRIKRSYKPRPLPKRRTVLVRRVKILPRRKKSKPTTPEPEKEELPDQNRIKLEPEEELSNLPNSTTVGKRKKTPTKERTENSKRLKTNSTLLAVIPPLSPPPPLPDPLVSIYCEPIPEKTHSNKDPSEPYSTIKTGKLDVSSPVTQIHLYKSYIIAAAEDGDIYMFDSTNHKLEQRITKHSEAITNMFLCEKTSCLYTTSLDGFFKKSCLKNMERILQNVYYKEPLQSVDVAWDIAFIGSRWGNIFKYNIATNKAVQPGPLLSTGQSVISVKATKEGVRKIVVLGCKGNFVYIHDANSGLLLRRLDIPEGLNIYSLLLNDGQLYCGTQKNQIYKFDFPSGGLISTMICGNGAVSLVPYKESFILAGCYDGYIYVLDKLLSTQMGRFEGSGRLVLSLAIAGDKIITSSKDNSLQILEIPPSLVTSVGI